MPAPAHKAQDGTLEYFTQDLLYFTQDLLISPKDSWRSKPHFEKYTWPILKSTSRSFYWLGVEIYSLKSPPPPPPLVRIATEKENGAFFLVMDLQIWGDNYHPFLDISLLQPNYFSYFNSSSKHKTYTT